MQEYPELSRIVNAFFRKGVMPETYATEKTTKTEDKKNNQTVYRNNSKRYYTKLDNASLRMKIPGEDKVTAKDIWLDALTCQDDWLFTTKNIADRWRISIKRAKNKLALLSKSGFAEPQKIIDPTDHKFLMHIWIFHEKPQPQKRGYGKSIINSKNNNEKTPKTHSPENGTVYHLENKEKKTTAKAPAGAAADLQKIRSKIDPEISRKIANDALEKLMGIPVERIEAASKEVMASRVKNKVGLFIKLANEIPPDNGLKPQDPPPDSTPKQKACIECYNSNCRKSEPTCQTMKPNDNGVRNHPGGDCKKYCPFVLQNLELFNLKKPVQGSPPQQTGDQEQIGTDELKSMLSALRNKFTMKL